MLPVFRSISLRHLRLRWQRAVLVVLSISVGVATLVSTRILNNCLEHAAHDTLTPIPTADLYVTNGEVGVSRVVADRLKAANLSGVQAVLPMIIEQVHISNINGEQGRTAVLIAADLHDFQSLQSGEKKAFDDDVAILNPLAASLGLGVYISEDLHNQRNAQQMPDAQPIMLRYTGRPIAYPVAGVLKIRLDGPAASFSRNLLFMPLPLAITFLKNPLPIEALLLAGGAVVGVDLAKEEHVSRVDLILAKGANLDQVRQAAENVVGSQAQVRTPEQQRKTTDDAISGIQISFTLCAAGALVVGLFLVFNAMSVSVAERRHDIGILRSLGATRWQIAQLFAGEAALLGAAGAILAVPMGIWFANLAFGVVEEDINGMFLAADIRPGSPSLITIVTAFVAGVTTALCAALIPAIQAASDEPADAARRAPSSSEGMIRRIHQAACLVLIVGGILGVLLREHFPEQLGSYIGLSMTLVGLFLALPIIVGWMATMAQPIFRALLGVEARLAADNMVRSPGRTGVVIGALAGGVSLMFQTAGVGRSNEEPMQEWLDRVIKADVFVFWGNLTSATSSMTPMSSSVIRDLEKIPEVENAVGIRILRPDYNGSVICVVGIDAKAYSDSVTKRHPKGSVPGIEKLGDLPGGDKVFMSENFRMKFHVKPGDKITLPRRHGSPVELEAIGSGPDYTWNKGTLFVDRKKYVEYFGDDAVDIVHVYFRDGVDPVEGRKKVEEALAGQQLVVEDNAFGREYLAGVIDRIYKLAYMQQIVVGIVAALGVITALLISVLQRTRELGLLRAVGASQTQVLKSVLSEAMLMGLLGTILGIAMGLPMEWFLLRVLIFEDSGFYFPMIIPWKQALGIGLGAVLIATLAGLVPALHACRMRITDAIAYE